VEQLRDDHHDGTAKMYEGGKRVFLSILGDCPVEYITPYDIKKIVAREFDKRGYSKGYIRILMAELKASINAALEEGLLELDEHPFRGYKMPQGKPRWMDITLGQFHRVVDYQPRTRRETVAKDMLLLSFYLCGINLADLVKADLSGEILSYSRQKTCNRKQGEDTTAFTIQPEAREIIQKYVNEEGRLVLFPERSNYESVRSYINKGLREMNETLRFTVPFSFYTARKTFAIFAFQLRVPTEVVEYCIGHSVKSGRAIYNYIRVMQWQADDAVRQVIDYTKGDVPVSATARGH
jgi:integrase